jgi:hypothetical protein
VDNFLKMLSVVSASNDEDITYKLPAIWSRKKGAYDIRGCWECGAPVWEPLHYVGCSRLQEDGPVIDDYIRHSSHG